MSSDFKCPNCKNEHLHVLEHNYCKRRVLPDELRSTPLLPESPTNNVVTFPVYTCLCIDCGLVFQYMPKEAVENFISLEANF